MPIYHSEGKPSFNTEMVLEETTVTFVANPSAIMWRRMGVAMMAHQQAALFGSPELIVDVSSMGDDEANEFYEKHIAL
jgi:hypothetical protein